MTWGKSVLLTIPLVFSGIFVVASPASATTVPAQITAATDWKSVSAGYRHTCAIRSIGKLYCWGNDDNGQLGNGTRGSTITPTQITTATDWKSVSAGYRHTCAIRSIGKLYCWGNDDNGQLGNGTGSSTITPTQITTATDWKTVSAGYRHTCATRGKLYCWGNDDNGQLGNGTGSSTITPTQITTATDWKTVSAGYRHTCATRGKLYCWGNDDNGQLGNGGGGSATVLVQITTATDWTTVSAGYAHTCATRGKLYCWGNDGTGQLGNGTGGPTTVPVQITTAPDWTTVSAGTFHTCATRGKLYCWGNDDSGQLGNGTGVSTTVPVQITTAPDWTTVSAGSLHTCATRGKLYCWGDDGTYPTPGSDYPAGVPGFESLSYWKLTTPIDGDDAGDNADEIEQPELATFKDPAYFHASSDNQKVYFRARVDGATTSGSEYPRSELREMKSNGSTLAGWSNMSESHQMTITQAITHLPDAKPDVVAGQIHGGSEGDMLQIRLVGTKLFARFEGKSMYDQTLNDDYQLGTMFTVVVTADSTGITVDYDDVLGVSQQASRPVTAGGPTWYFKAGVYTQSNTTKDDVPEAYGEVLIDSVSITPVT